MFVIMALLCVPGVWLTTPNTTACLRAFASPAACGFLAVLVIVCTLGGYLFMNRWQRDVTATEAGLIYSVEPVITSVLALFLPGLISIWAGISYPNEILTTRLLIGGGLVTAANVLCRNAERPAQFVCPGIGNFFSASVYN
jgi:drug/metabolite transporter (DMT)-like permease